MSETTATLKRPSSQEKLGAQEAMDLRPVSSQRMHQNESMPVIGRPEQPQEEETPPLMSNKTIKEVEDTGGDGAVTPYKQSFQQSNQDAIEKNEELLSLLACLNE